MHGVRLLLCERRAGNSRVGRLSLIRFFLKGGWQWSVGLHLFSACSPAGSSAYSDAHSSYPASGRNTQTDTQMDITTQRERRRNHDRNLVRYDRIVYRSIRGCGLDVLKLGRG